MNQIQTKTFIAIFSILRLDYSLKFRFYKEQLCAMKGNWCKEQD